MEKKDWKAVFARDDQVNFGVFFFPHPLQNGPLRGAPQLVQESLLVQSRPWSTFILQYSSHRGLADIMTAQREH